MYYPAPLRTRRPLAALTLLATLICSTSAISSDSGATTEEAATIDVIAYTAAMPNDVDLFLVDLSASQPEMRRLERPHTIELDPAFSPDGQWLALSLEERGVQNLFAVPSATLDFDQAIQLTFSEAADSAPAISPDGKWLAFVSSRSGRSEIWLQPFHTDNPRAAAERARNLTPGSGSEFRPAFSPDGRFIAYSRTCCSSEDRFLTRIEVLDLFSREISVLTDGTRFDGSPGFSADGSTLFFHRAVRGKSPVQAFADPAIFSLALRVDEAGQLVAGEPSRQSESQAQELVAFPTSSGLARLRLVEGSWALATDPATGGSPTVWRSRQTSFYALAVSPDGQRIVLSGADRNLQGDPLQQDPASSPILLEHGFTTQLGTERPLRLIPTHLVFPSFTRDDQLVGGHFTGDLVRAPVPSQESADADVHRFQADTGELPRLPGAIGLFGHHADPLSDDMVSTVGMSFGPPDAAADLLRFTPDGEGQNLTSDSKGNDALGKFSPDGRWIVFRSGRDGNHEIYLMDRDGENPRRLTNHPATDTAPAFAPDGRQIAFVSTRDGNHEIYLLDLDEHGNALGEPSRLTHHPWIDMHPEYSPDGQWLVFASDRSGEPDEVTRSQMRFSPQPGGELWALRLADRYLQRLTHNGWEDGLPSWGRVNR